MKLKMKFVYGVMINGAIDGKVYTKRKFAIERCIQIYEGNTFIHNCMQEIYTDEQDDYMSFDAWFNTFVTNCNDVLEICTLEIIEGE